MAKTADKPLALSASMRVVVLSGKDAYLLAQRRKELRELLDKAFGGVDEFSYDGESCGLAEVLDELRSFGLMAGHKLVVLDAADSFLRNEERRRALERYCAEPVESATFLLRASKWQPGNLDKIIAKAGGALLKCDPPDDERAETFCERRAIKEHRIPIDPDAAALLVERIGPDLARLDSELGKLAATVCERPDPRITRADVAEMVGIGREEQAWAIQEALLSGNPTVALTKLRELLVISEVPEQVIVWSMVDLVRKIHDCSRLLTQGEPEFAVTKAVKLWGPTQAPILRIARRLTPTTATRLLEAAIGLDLGVRRGTTRDFARRLQGFSVELTDSFAR